MYMMPPMKRVVNLKGEMVGGIGHSLYLPINYDDLERWPFIIFLHDHIEQTHKSDRYRGYGLPDWLDRWNYIPFVVLAPRCPYQQNWEAVEVQEMLIEHIRSVGSYTNIHWSHVYLTGFGAGGQGVLSMAQRYPSRFAAIAPVASALPTDADFKNNVCKLQMPTWLFHSKVDTTIPIKESDELVDILQVCEHSKLKYIQYDDLTHRETATTTYANEDLYDWFLNWSRPKE